MSDESNIISIFQRRSQQAESKVQTVKPPELRIQELEADMFHLIELVIEQDRRLDAQYDTLHKLLRLLKESK